VEPARNDIAASPDAGSPTIPSPAIPGRPRRLRIAAGIAALGAAVVALVFTLVGDGVDDSAADGLAGVALEFGHGAAWACIACALAAIALDRGPRWVPQAVGLTSLACYGAFLVALFTSG